MVKRWLTNCREGQHVHSSLGCRSESDTLPPQPREWASVSWSRDLPSLRGYFGILLFPTICWVESSLIKFYCHILYKYISFKKRSRKGRMAARVLCVAPLVKLSWGNRKWMGVEDWMTKRSISEFGPRSLGRKRRPRAAVSLQCLVYQPRASRLFRSMV